jgi:hypothetical protein
VAIQEELEHIRVYDTWITTVVFSDSFVMTGGDAGVMTEYGAGDNDKRVCSAPHYNKH